MLEQRFLEADQLGIRLEMVRGLPIWEAHPVWKHQKAIDRIRETITPLSQASDSSHACECIHASDVYISFPDGSLKRPDIAIFCKEPQEEDEAITLIPEAVIEVISKGFEAKDLDIGPNFYLSQGIKDIAVFNPYTLSVLHVRQDRTQRFISPVKLDFLCGCYCTV